MFIVTQIMNHYEVLYLCNLSTKPNENTEWGLCLDSLHIYNLYQHNLPFKLFPYKYTYLVFFKSFFPTPPAKNKWEVNNTYVRTWHFKEKFLLKLIASLHILIFDIEPRACLDSNMQLREWLLFWNWVVQTPLLHVWYASLINSPMRHVWPALPSPTIFNLISSCSKMGNRCRSRARPGKSACN